MTHAGRNARNRGVVARGYRVHPDPRQGLPAAAGPDVPAAGHFEGQDDRELVLRSLDADADQLRDRSQAAGGGRDLDHGVEGVFMFPLLERIADTLEWLIFAHSIQRVIDRLKQRALIFTAADIGANPLALKLAITSTKFKQWSRAIHGLSVATSVPKEIGDGRAIVIVAVSNVLPEPLRIVPGQPELAIETRDDNGKTLLVERIKPLHVESSAMDNSIPAGAKLYYAIVYQQPVLGVRQHVRVFVGQINAADDPAVADLSASAK